MPPRLLFVIWCVLENSLIHGVIFDFLLCVTKKNGRRYLPVWLAVNAALTFLVTWFQLPGTFFLDILVLFVFAKAALQIRGSDLVAPATILFTFCTFRESYAAFFLSWISSTVDSPTGGRLEQILVSLLLDLLLFGTLWVIRKRYAYTLGQSISSCLYILLLPCAVIVLNLRYGLRLDSRHLEQHLSSFGKSGRITVLLLMLAATLMAFLMIEVFCRIIQLTGHEKAAALLQSQLSGQKVYLEEARKRNERYASFQHDIDNHLMVLTGLLREKRFAQAEQYAEKLRLNGRALSVEVSTGNPVLDILLKEKLSHAKGNGIAVTQEICIPENAGIDDMDLCVIFANILDNAITACIEEAEKDRFLSLTAKRKSQFLIVEAVNAAGDGPPVCFGTGLMNVRHIAEKYEGTMETERGGGQFRISVLLCVR